MSDTRTYPSRPIVGVGAVIVDAGHVVLVRRRYEPLAGRWSLPGGTLEVGETLEEGLAREMREETGLEVRVGPVIEVFDRIIRDDDARVRYQVRKNWSAAVGVDNLNNDKYFLFHPFPQRTAVAELKFDM